jgi:ferredoxin-NADP reductase
MNLLGFFRLTRLRFIEKAHENGDIYTFHFKPARPLKHRAGEHGVFFLPGFRGVHIFSLSSSPDEDVAISTHARKESRYKQRLMNLKAGESMWVLGPILNFTYRPGAKHLVFLAQGIGITPFRSMLVYARAHDMDIHTTLIHVDGGGHTFAPLTRRLASLAHFPTNPEEFTAFVQEATKDKDALFYLSGSPRFVRATKKTLRGLGVNWRRVKADTFLGY